MGISYQFFQSENQNLFKKPAVAPHQRGVPICLTL